MVDALLCALPCTAPKNSLSLLLHHDTEREEYNQNYNLGFLRWEIIFFLSSETGLQAGGQCLQKILKTVCKKKNSTLKGPWLFGFVPNSWSAMTDIFISWRKTFFSAHQLLPKINRIYNFVLNTFNTRWFRWSFFSSSHKCICWNVFPEWSHQNCKWVRSAVTQGLGLHHWSTGKKALYCGTSIYHWISLKQRIIMGLWCRNFICSNWSVFPINIWIFLATWGCAWLVLSYTAYWRGSLCLVRNYRTF